MLRKRSLGATVALGFACLLVIMAAATTYAVRDVEATRDQRRLAVDALLPGADAADRMALNAVRFEDALQGFVATRSPDDLSDARLARALVRQAALDLGRIRIADPRVQYLAAQVGAIAADFARQAPEAERYAYTTGAASAETYLQQYLKGTVAALVAATQALNSHLAGQTAAIRAQISAREAHLARSLSLAFALAGLLGVGLALYCLRLVTEPVGRLLLAARAVEAGDYPRARRLAEKEAGTAARGLENELTTLARAFTHMASALDEREHRLRAQTTHLRDANAQLTALQSLTDVALSDLPLDELLQELLQRVVAGLGGDAGALFLVDPEGGYLQPHAVWAIEAQGAGAPAALELADSIAAAEHVVACEDLSGAAGPASSFLTDRGVRAYLAVPLRLGEQTVGVAHIEFSRPRSFEPAALNLMQVLGERAARAVERARTLEELASWGRELERRVRNQQDQLLRSERLVAIGLVGGGIAHELRNPLGVISNAIYYLRRRADGLDAKMQRHLEIIDREIGHSKRIIDNLVDYASSIEPESRRLDLNALLGTAVEYARIPETVAVDLRLAEGLPALLGDESQLLQVFEHLIRNAVQAMENQGRIMITTGASDAALWITVEDTGPGVPPEIQGQIFEPLVTTRAKGMGLGLALCRKILEAHGGEIRLVSRPGPGAIFRVELPITEGPPAPAPGEPTEAPAQRSVPVGSSAIDGV